MAGDLLGIYRLSCLRHLALRGKETGNGRMGERMKRRNSKEVTDPRFSGSPILSVCAES